MGIKREQAWRSEVIGGVTTFLTMAYIIVVNPSILASQNTGMQFSGVLTATVLLSFLMTLFMGLYAKLPFAVAPGMGINAYLAYSIIIGQKVPWPVALGMIFWAGVFFVIISVTPLRVALAKSIPLQLREASAVGIGLFLTFIGLKNANLIVADPTTFVRAGPLKYECIMALVGLAIMIWMFRKKNPLAILAGIFFVVLMDLLLGKARLPDQVLTAPDFKSVFFKLDVVHSLKLSLAPAIISILFTDLFDSISTFVGVSQGSGLLDKKGEPKNLKEGLIVDAFATLCAGLAGTSSGTAFIESAAGIEAGGRTGLSAVVTALCFLPFFFLAPLVLLVPPYATAPALILIGALMFRGVGKLKFSNLEEILPAFLVVVLIPLTFSITQGIIWGFISHTCLYWLAGRRRELSPMLYGVTIVCVLLLVIQNR